MTNIGMNEYTWQQYEYVHIRSRSDYQFKKLNIIYTRLIQCFFIKLA